MINRSPSAIAMAVGYHRWWRMNLSARFQWLRIGVVDAERVASEQLGRSARRTLRADDRREVYGVGSPDRPADRDESTVRQKALVGAEEVVRCAVLRLRLLPLGLPAPQVEHPDAAVDQRSSSVTGDRSGAVLDSLRARPNRRRGRSAAWPSIRRAGS